MIALKYSCSLCGLVDTAIYVRLREAEEDVRDWMNVVVHVVAYDHGNQSPQCRAKKISNLKIPITGVDRIGDMARN